MNDTPLISVVMPAFNAEKTIKETIDSVLKQTHSHLELIIINDGSQDSTLDIINSTQDPRLKVFSYLNSGLAASRNRGFHHSIGGYVSFIDADDIWTPDKIEAQLKALQANPDAAVAYSWTDLIDESGQFLRSGNHTTANGNIYAQLLLGCFVVSGSNPLICRQAFIEVGGFDESLAASQDFDLYLRLAARYDYVAVPSPHVLYRISPNSMSTNVRRHEYTSLLVRERAFEQSPEVLPQALKHHSVANYYKSVIYRLLNAPPSPKSGLEAARLLYNAVRYDPSFLQKKVFGKLLLKTLIFLILPPQLAQALIGKIKDLSNIDSILVHIKTNPSELA